ncbi:hypothetical protein DSM104443_00608 [Usitatibacter rugosus]|uniref:Uncharacterized protein n=1 Tax=Usitatibacter rugosus TaxID=2732067 RepID=A0A6M4GQD4_9PROT|nr:hypothetical protein [Usitatibacter rugosus]QJR09559.1 hypothetical protein DSM104443_00608 [Usitatibacter rugosus]
MNFPRACLALLCAFASTAFAADRIWTGSSPASPKRWSDRFNWEGNVAPQPNDRLIFPATSNAKASLNDYPLTPFSGIVFNDPAGHAITSDVPPLRLSGALPIVVEAEGGTFTTGAIAIAANSARVTVNRPPGAPPGDAPVLLPGVITVSSLDRFEATTGRIVFTEAISFPEFPQGGGITVAGNIELRIRAPYNISTRIEGGVVKVTSKFGTQGATLWAGRLEYGPFQPGEDPNYIDANLYLTGPPEPELGNVSTVVPIFRGVLRVEGTQTFVGGALTFAGPINGAGVMRLKVTGNGCATYASSENSFTGGIDIAQGTLCFLQDERIPNAVPVTVSAAGTLQLGAGGVNHSSPIRETVRSLSCAGKLNFLEAGMVSLRVLQPSSIAGCQLSVTPGVSVDAARGITLVANESGQPFTGAFSNAPEGTSYTINGTPMRLTYHGGTGNDIALVAAPSGEAPSVQDMWWVGPGENGWGMSIVQHGEKLFGVIYAYDITQRPTWFVMSSGAWNANHTEYTGDVYTPSGAPFFAYDAARFAVGEKVGRITIAFADAQHATLRYTIHDITGEKAIVRQQFGPAVSRVHADNSDMWWGGVTQNGWGVAVIQQYESVFLVWFTYDAAGAARWYVMPAGTWTGNAFSGRIYRTIGTPWDSSRYDPASFRSIDVGSFSVRFDAPATLEYTIDGRQGTLAIGRTPF